MEKMFLSMNKKNSQKIHVTGYPKIVDFISNKKKKYKKINNILFLSFDTKLGFPMNSKYEKLNFNFTYDRVIEMLNDISRLDNIKICIKRKNKNPILYKSKLKIDKKN